MNKQLDFYIYELAWILPSVAIPVAMLTALLLSAFAVGIQVPGDDGKIDPTKVEQTAPFNQPGVKQVAPGRYEAVMVAQVWNFVPKEVKVPVNSTVNFIVTSKDVVHGLKIEGTNINMMVLPGRISRLEGHFKAKGDYLFVCHEYCGIGHHTMSGKVVVE